MGHDDIAKFLKSADFSGLDVMHAHEKAMRDIRSALSAPYNAIDQIASIQKQLNPLVSAQKAFEILSEHQRAVGRISGIIESISAASFRIPSLKDLLGNDALSAITDMRHFNIETVYGAASDISLPGSVLTTFNKYTSAYASWSARSSSGGDSETVLRAEMQAVDLRNEAEVVSLIFDDDADGSRDPIETDSIVAGVASRARGELTYADVAKWVAMLDGARQTAERGGPDCMRQVSASLREFFRVVTHHLSPDKLIEKWSKSSDDYHDGKPTRAARLRYIMRGFDGDDFRDVIEADIDAALALMRYLNKTTHYDDNPMSRVIMLNMITRMELLACQFFDISKIERIG